MYVFERFLEGDPSVASLLDDEGVFFEVLLDDLGVVASIRTSSLGGLTDGTGVFFLLDFLAAGGGDLTAPSFEGV